MTVFFSGMITMGFLMAALFFLKFWSQTRDELFAVFAIAFFLFAINQGLISGIASSRDEKIFVYLLRLAGFSLIIFAIVRKNWRSDG